MTASRILIIEDDPALLRGLKDNFAAAGYDVRTAADGQRGLDALLAEPPDLVLLDLMLPRVSGYDICRTARERGLAMPIIMLTAKGQEEDIVRGLELGAAGYVTKPIRIRELLGSAISASIPPRTSSSAATPRSSSPARSTSCSRSSSSAPAVPSRATPSSTASGAMRCS